MTQRVKSKLTSREYISRQGIGNSEECELLKQRASQTLRSWLLEREIEGFLVRTLSSESDIIHEDLMDFDIPKLTDGRLPVVWMNVTFLPPQFPQSDRNTFEGTHHLQLICETESLD